MSESRKELISHHTFMLPFKWTPKDKDGFISIKEFNGVVQHYLDSGNWKSEKFTLDRVVDYNEFHYFYDYVREALYDYGETKTKDSGERFVRHLSHTNVQGGKYYIETPIPPSERDPSFPHNDGHSDTAFRKTYELEIDSVLLHLYYTGVGVLSFHLHNRRDDQASPEDILYINQYGRRVFPPFYRVSHWKAGHQVGFDSEDFTVTGRPHGGEIAYSIGIKLPGMDRLIRENWHDEPPRMLRDENTLTFRLAKFIEPFLGELYTYPQSNNTPDELPSSSQEKKPPLVPGDYKIQSVLDDRMFTICWYGNATITKRLAAKQVEKERFRNGRFLHREVEGTEADQLNMLYTDDWLYKFIFVDAGQVTVQNAAMRRQLLKDAVYLRWSGFGTYYGITDYSFVLLTEELPSLRKPWNNASFLVTHLQSIYFRLCELVLVQRASVQRFSDEVTHVSRLEIPDVEDKSFDKDVNRLSAYANELYKRYIRFVNRVYFREVTAQVQGIELYEKLHQQARLPAMVDGLKEEIHELHNYVRQETDRQLLEVEKGRKATEEERANFLTLLGALFLAPALLVAVYDLGFYGDCLKAYPNVFYPLTILAAVLTAVIFYQTFVVPESDKASAEELKAGNTKRRKRLPYAVGMYLALLLSPMIYGWFHCPAPTPATVVTGDVRVIPPAASGNENIAPKEQEELKLKVPQPPTMQSLPTPDDKAKATDQKSIKE